MAERCWNPSCSRKGWIEDWCGWHWCLRHWWFNWRWSGSEYRWWELWNDLKATIRGRK